MIKFKENVFSINGKEYQLNHQILGVIEFKNNIIVLFDACKNENDFKQLANIWAFDKNGKKLWEAQRPPEHFQDDYYTTLYIENDKLIAHSFGTFMCTLDPSTGKILESFMTK